MSTRSAIAIQETKDGPVQHIYCHFDGYLKHNGKILNEHYRDPAKVKELLALGDMSVLDETIEKSTFYCRDRKERLHINKPMALKELADDDTYDYRYLLKEHGGEWKWFLFESVGKTVKLSEVDQAIAEGAYYGA